MKLSEIKDKYGGDSFCRNWWGLRGKICEKCPIFFPKKVLVRRRNLMEPPPFNGKNKFGGLRKFLAQPSSQFLL